jgi:hypothetical protein
VQTRKVSCKGGGVLKLQNVHWFSMCGVVFRKE